MIDTHCHLLHGLDDGPRTLDEAVEFGVSLVEQGVRHAVCTPHFSRQFPTTHDASCAALAELEAEFATLNVPLTLSLGAEISEAIVVELDRAALRERCINGRYLLVEVEQTSTRSTIEATVRRLDMAGFVAVIAHPERLPVFQRAPAFAGTLRRLGALTQVVAPSVTGRWGRSVEATAWSMLTKGHVDLIASDAHGTGRRRCRMAEAEVLVHRRLGARVWSAVAEEAPATVVGAGSCA